MTIILILFCLCLVVTNKVDATLSISRIQDLEMETHLKLINKPPIRSIKTKSGDIIDCVDIEKQPAFEHRLLKNHKLQRMPTFLNRRARKNEQALPTRTSGFEKVLCPIGSVPIRRTTKADLIRMKSISNQTHTLTQESRASHVYTPTWQTLTTKKRNNNSYYGVNAHVNVYNPRVKKTQTSLAQIGVQNGEFDGTNTILFGWQVAPLLYGRESTNVFALWTSDAFKKTGCYNMLCPGFVQIDRSIFLGIRVAPKSISSYGGPQFEFSQSISQDPYTKDWWLIIQDILVGYFPAVLFSNMSVADLVGWGGRVSGVVDGTSPQMGSGYFPDGDLTHACFMRQISYNASGSFEEPQENLLGISVDNRNCYNLKYLGFLDDANRVTFQFGGPGGDCGM